MAADKSIVVIVNGVTMAQAKLAANAVLGMFPEAEVDIETSPGCCLKPKVVNKEHY